MPYRSSLLLLYKFRIPLAGKVEIALLGSLRLLLKTVQHIDRILNFATYNTRKIPASSLIRISCTPDPTSDIGLKSSGSSPFCTRSSWYPASRRASLGNSQRSFRELPLNLRSFTAVFFGRCAMTEYYINTYIKTSSWRQTGFSA